MGRRLIFRHPTGRATAFDPEAPLEPATKSPRWTTHPARTAIRHRCARRASEGVRENPREGTRQNDPVPSVQGVLIPRGMSRSESALATVYQKHRTLPTRKRTYRV